MPTLTKGAKVSFAVDGDGEIIHGRILHMDVQQIDGVATATMDEPVHIVSTDNGIWAIHPSWIVKQDNPKIYEVWFDVCVHVEADDEDEALNLANSFIGSSSAPEGKLWTYEVQTDGIAVFNGIRI